MWRQEDIFLPTAATETVTIIGAGGIGSNAAMTMAMLGVGVGSQESGSGTMTIWDGDMVEEHNLPNQLYGEEDVGKPKVVALQEHVRRQTGFSPTPVAKFWDGEKLTGLVVSGLDSMAVRKKLWDSLKHKSSSLYVDGRMGGEAAIIYAARPMDPDDVKFYESELNTDEDSPDIPCTARAVIYNTSRIGALISNIIKRWSRGEEFPRELIFDFATYYIATRELKK